MTDHPTMRLGKKPPRHLERLPLLSRYTAALPPAPDAVNWSAAPAADMAGL